MEGSTQLIGATVLLGMTVAIVWLQAPVIPAIVGAVSAGLLYYWRRRSPQ